MRAVGTGLLVVGCLALILSVLVMVRMRQMASSPVPVNYPEIQFVAGDLMKGEESSGPVDPAQVASQVQSRILGLGAGGAVGLLIGLVLIKLTPSDQNIDTKKG